MPLTAGCSVQDVIRFGWPVGVTPQAGVDAQPVDLRGRSPRSWSASITWGAMFWAIAFHRKRKGSDGDIPPRQTQYNLPVEIVFTVIPDDHRRGPLRVHRQRAELRGEGRTRTPTCGSTSPRFQWNWRFDYPDAKGVDGQPVSTLGAGSTIPLLVLPTGKRIEFSQRSNDVIHSFFVPEFLFKRDVFPMPEVNDQDDTLGRSSSIDKEGAFVGRCTSCAAATTRR